MVSPMIKLFTFPPCLNSVSASPFCIKLETFLKMSKVPYQCIYITNPSKAPKGKLPYICDGERTIADSSLIIDYIKQQYQNIDSHLSPQQYGTSIAVQRLFEDHLYWAIVYSRWIDQENWPIIKETFFSDLPRMLRPIIPALLKKKMHQALKHQGLGRHSADEIYHLAIQSLEAVAAILEDQRYFFNQKPSSIDAIAYGFLSSILYPSLRSPLKTTLLQQTTLLQYCKHIHQDFFPDVEIDQSFLQLEQVSST